ncbi:MAG: hypothetical protein HFH23_00865 [Ruminococcus sp.]|nr:hypothetical protein [Ruminococcus sp.]
MKRLSESLVLGTIGGTIYYSLEVIFRGFSHWTMWALGGLCMVFFGMQGVWVNWQDPLWRQVLRCTLFVGCGEFTTGIIVNKWFKLHVWDYSNQPLQLFGQVCVPFLILFSGLCLLGILFCGYFLHWVYHEEKPAFHIL